MTSTANAPDPAENCSRFVDFKDGLAIGFVRDSNDQRLLLISKVKISDAWPGTVTVMTLTPAFSVHDAFSQAHGFPEGENTGDKLLTCGSRFYFG